VLGDQRDGLRVVQPQAAIHPPARDIDRHVDRQLVPFLRCQVHGS
jgi:hypothetical protein